MVGRMNSKEIFDRLGEEHIRKNYAKYVPRQVLTPKVHPNSTLILVAAGSARWTPAPFGTKKPSSWDYT